MDISEFDLRKLIKLYKDKEIYLMIEILKICFNDKSNLSNKDIEFLNKINPKILKIEKIMQTVENIKALVLLNCINIDTCFINYLSNMHSHIWFINTPIQLFDSFSDQRLTFEWESIKFFIESNKIESVKLLNINTGKLLFIPLNTIGRIVYSGFKEILSENYINKQFSDLDVEHQFDTNGFILPVWYLYKTFIKLDDNELRFLNQFKDIIQISKEKYIKLSICNLDKLLKINKQLPDDFSKINFKYFNKRITMIAKNLVSEIVDNIGLNNLKFINIRQWKSLSHYELTFWWNVLRSSRTRFNVTSIHLNFKLLSECLTVLSLCSACPELKSVVLGYSKADAENKDEVIEQAKREFWHKFGFIHELEIWKYFQKLFH